MEKPPHWNYTLPQWLYKQKVDEINILIKQLNAWPKKGKDVSVLYPKIKDILIALPLKKSLQLQKKMQIFLPEHSEYHATDPRP